MIFCRACGSENLATLEHLEGTAEIILKLGKEGIEYEHTGTTVIAWDSSQTIGFTCLSCGAESEALEALVTINPDE